MIGFPHSMVVICPAEVRETLLATGRALGVEGGMTVELSPDGQAPATHYGSHSWAGPGFVAVMTGQVVPEGFDPQQVAALLAMVAVSVDPVVDGRTLTKRDHFDHVAANLGLQQVTYE